MSFEPPSRVDVEDGTPHYLVRSEHGGLLWQDCAGGSVSCEFVEEEQGVSDVTL